MEQQTKVPGDQTPKDTLREPDGPTGKPTAPVQATIDPSVPDKLWLSEGEGEGEDERPLYVAGPNSLLKHASKAPDATNLELGGKTPRELAKQIRLHRSSSEKEIKNPRSYAELATMIILETIRNGTPEQIEHLSKIVDTCYDEYEQLSNTIQKKYTQQLEQQERKASQEAEQALHALKEKPLDDIDIPKSQQQPDETTALQKLRDNLKPPFSPLTVFGMLLYSKEDAWKDVLKPESHQAKWGKQNLQRDIAIEIIRSLGENFIAKYIDDLLTTSSPDRMSIAHQTIYEYLTGIDKSLGTSQINYYSTAPFWFVRHAELNRGNSSLRTRMILMTTSNPSSTKLEQVYTQIQEKLMKIYEDSQDRENSPDQARRVLPSQHQRYGGGGAAYNSIHR